MSLHRIREPESNHHACWRRNRSLSVPPGQKTGHWHLQPQSRIMIDGVGMSPYSASSYTRGSQCSSARAVFHPRYCSVGEMERALYLRDSMRTSPSPHLFFELLGLAGIPTTGLDPRTPFIPEEDEGEPQSKQQRHEVDGWVIRPGNLQVRVTLYYGRGPHLEPRDTYSLDQHTYTALYILNTDLQVVPITCLSIPESEEIRIAHKVKPKQLVRKGLGIPMKQRWIFYPGNVHVWQVEWRL